MIISKREKKKENKYHIRWIYFYLTEGCNLKCRHCWIAPKYQNEKKSFPSLGLDLFISIIKQAKQLGLRSVKLTGGEPLLHPKIYDILKFIQSEDIRLVVETNGTLCTPEITKEISKCKNPFVSVSLDGSNSETHEWVRGVKGCFNASVDGIKNLVKTGLKPQIIFTIMRRNKDQLEDIVHLAESLGAGSIKFNILQPIARGEKMHKLDEVLTIKELIDLGKWVNNKLSSLTKLHLYYDQPLAFCPLSKMFSKDGSGCSTCAILSIIGVLADGSYALCGIGSTVPELIFGNAVNDSLYDIWNNSSVLVELRNGLPEKLEGICNRCLMKNICLGSCIAQNYYRTKNLWAPYWFCKEASEQGLFPETRINPNF